MVSRGWVHDAAKRGSTDFQLLQQLFNKVTNGINSLIPRLEKKQLQLFMQPATDYNQLYSKQKSRHTPVKHCAHPKSKFALSLQINSKFGDSLRPHLSVSPCTSKALRWRNLEVRHMYLANRPSGNTIPGLTKMSWRNRLNMRIRHQSFQQTELNVHKYWTASEIQLEWTAVSLK